MNKFWLVTQNQTIEENKEPTIDTCMEYIKKIPNGYLVKTKTSKPFAIVKEKIRSVTVNPVYGQGYDQKLYTIIYAKTKEQAIEEAKNIFQNYREHHKEKDSLQCSLEKIQNDFSR